MENQVQVGDLNPKKGIKPWNSNEKLLYKHKGKLFYTCKTKCINMKQLLPLGREDCALNSPRQICSLAPSDSLHVRKDQANPFVHCPPMHTAPSRSSCCCCALLYADSNPAPGCGLGCSLVLGSDLPDSWLTISKSFTKLEVRPQERRRWIIVTVEIQLSRKLRQLGVHWDQLDVAHRYLGLLCPSVERKWYPYGGEKCAAADPALSTGVGLIWKQVSYELLFPDNEGFGCTSSAEASWLIWEQVLLFFFLFSKSIFNMPGTEHLKKNSVLKSWSCGMC